MSKKTTAKPPNQPSQSGSTIASASSGPPTPLPPTFSPAPPAQVQPKELVDEPTSAYGLLEKLLIGSLKIDRPSVLYLLFFLITGFISWIFLVDNEKGKLDDWEGIKKFGLKALVFGGLVICSMVYSYCIHYGFVSIEWTKSTALKSRRNKIISAIIGILFMGFVIYLGLHWKGII